MQLGKGVKQRDADQLAAKLASGLRAGESIERVHRGSNMRLLIDRLVLTNFRLLGVENRKGAVKVAMDRDELSGASAESSWAGGWVEVADRDGARHKFSTVDSSDAKALVTFLSAPPLGPKEPTALEAPSARDAARMAVNLAIGGPVGAKEVAARDRTKAFEKERKFRVREEYGDLVLAKNFALAAVEIYSKGFVRVGAGSTDVDTPFERLRRIEARVVVQAKSAGGRALGSAVTGGWSRLNSAEHRIAFLTIATDKQTHSLRRAGGQTADTAAFALEAAGNGVLDSLKEADPGPTPAAGPTAADRLRQLAELRDEGLLSDEEFAAARARLLEEL